MALKTETALLTGLATAAVVVAVYQHNLPPAAQVRASAPGNPHVASSRRQAAIIAAGVVGAISILAKDPTVFVIGGATLIALDVTHRAANATDHTTGKIPQPAPDATAAPTGQ